MPLPAHLRVEVQMQETATGNTGRIILYYSAIEGDEPTVETIQEIANDFRVAFATALPAVLPSICNFTAVQCRWLGVSADVEAISTNGSVGGAAPSAVFPEEVAVCIQRRTGVKGRANRGRVFMPFVPLAFALGSTLTSQAITLYKAVGTMIHGNVEAGPGNGIFRAVTPNFKNNVLNPVVQTRVLSELCSRRDRRFVKRGQPLAAPAPIG